MLYCFYLLLQIYLSLFFFFFYVRGLVTACRPATCSTLICLFVQTSFFWFTATISTISCSCLTGSSYQFMCRHSWSFLVRLHLWDFVLKVLSTLSFSLNIVGFKILFVRVLMLFLWICKIWRVWRIEKLKNWKLESFQSIVFCNYVWYFTVNFEFYLACYFYLTDTVLYSRVSALFDCDLTFCLFYSYSCYVGDCIVLFPTSRILCSFLIWKCNL